MLFRSPVCLFVLPYVGTACRRDRFRLPATFFLLSPKKKAKMRLGAVPQDPLLIRELLGIMKAIQLYHTLPCDLLRL